ncbi:MAG: HAMP domain-containing protein, partial [Deltaproteobacteria bacterium]|nr:HAMP domain-containing protein [Deltaproteobacteria bacterium]
MIRRWKQSLLVRLTLLFSLTAFVVLCILGMAITRSIDRHFLHLDQGILQHQLNTLRNVFGSLRADQDPRRQLADIISRHGASALILERDGALWSVNAGDALPDRAALDGPEDFPLHWENSAGRYRGLRGVFRTNHPDLPEGVLIVALETSVHTIFLTDFHRTMWLIIGLAALFIGFLGWAAARTVLLPLRNLITDASGVSAGNLDMRLPVATLPFEMQELAQRLNAMLERLERAFTRLTDFSSDLAHELRTPLSAMKIQTQVALSRNRAPDEYRDILQSNAEELDRLARIVNDMLFL